MTTRRWRCLLPVALTCFAWPVSSALAAEEKDEASPHASRLTLEAIFSDGEYASESFSARWLEDGSGYTYVEDTDEGSEIWQSLVGEKEDRPVVRASELTPVETDRPLKIDDYAFSDDGAFLLIYTNTKRVWRQNTRGDYWVLDRASGVLRKLGGSEAPPSSLMFAKISPTGRQVAYVRQRNLYVEDLVDQSIRALTSSESEHIINGTSDWVYEEEFGVRDGFRWSPDGGSIAYWQFDESEVRRYTIVDQVSGLYPELKSFAYPKVGQRNAACRVGVIDLLGGASSGDTVWMEVPGDSRNHYIARMEWHADGKSLVLQQLNRAQNTNTIFLADPKSGKTLSIFAETDEAWVDIHDEMYWVREGQWFTWMSDRDGWRHLYLVSRHGEEIISLTSGEFDVIRLLEVDDEDEWAYFIASPDNPAERYLYRVRLDGSGLTRLTPAHVKRGTHSYNIASTGKHAILTSSTWDDPPVTSLVSLPDYKTLKVLESNKELKEKLDALERPTTEFFYTDIGAGVPLHGRCMLPPKFDPEKRYPLLIYVYGEPVGQVVTDRWGREMHLWHMMLAQQGYVVASIDNRGAAAPRGREYRKASFRKLGILPPQDQAAAVRALLKERPYLDPKRVGSWGWSGGGSMSLNAIFKYPEVYTAAIAIASVPNQRYYDTIYQERYMGLPEENPEGYHEGSPIHFADQLKGDLLIVHGAADDNCHYQTFEKLVDKLVRLNKPFTMMTYPRGTHSIKEGKNTRIHLYSLMTRFLHNSLPLTE